MLNLNKPRYLVASVGKHLSRRGFRCPSCGHDEHQIVDRKYLVTSLVRCSNCALLYRLPTTGPDESKRFYQRAYRQGSTTELPTDAQLASLLADGFSSIDQSFGAYIDVLRALDIRPGARVLDFGCSWGYGAWQLARVGYDVHGYEVSDLRCAFARDKLQLAASSSLDDVHGLFDAVLAVHVLEHVPSVSETVTTIGSLLRPGGLLVAFTPNGSNPFRFQAPRSWHRLWGMVHPQFLDDVYYGRLFAGRPTLLASNPYELRAIQEWRSTDASLTLDLSGAELLAVARAEQ